MTSDSAVVVASSRSRATEVYLYPDGRMIEVQHLKSGRDTWREVQAVPDYLTVRYREPYPVAEPVREYAER